MGARCIGIRAIEARRPLISAVAVEIAKMHGTAQLRRTNFFQFITLRGFVKIKNRRDSKVALVSSTNRPTKAGFPRPSPLVLVETVQYLGTRDGGMQRFVLAIGSAAQEPLSRKRRASPWPAVPGLTGKIQSAGVERRCGWAT